MFGGPALTGASSPIPASAIWREFPAWTIPRACNYGPLPIRGQCTGVIFWVRSARPFPFPLKSGPHIAKCRSAIKYKAVTPRLTNTDGGVQRQAMVCGATPVARAMNSAVPENGETMVQVPQVQR